MERIVLVCDRCGAQDAHPVQLLIGRRKLVTDLCDGKTRARPRAATLRTGAQDVASQVTKLRERGLSYRQIGDALMESGIKPRRAARWNRDVLARMVSQSAA